MNRIINFLWHFEIQILESYILPNIRILNDIPRPTAKNWLEDNLHTNRNF